jgi:hypothetical protein
MADNFAQHVKQQADILKIVGQYVRLKKGGAKLHRSLPLLLRKARRGSASDEKILLLSGFFLSRDDRGSENIRGYGRQSLLGLMPVLSRCRS